jgi:hypothetical protein
MDLGRCGFVENEFSERLLIENHVELNIVTFICCVDYIKAFGGANCNNL